MLVCSLFLTASSCQPARHLLDTAVTFPNASSHVSLGHSSKGPMSCLADCKLQADPRCTPCHEPDTMLCAKTLQKKENRARKGPAHTVTPAKPGWDTVLTMGPSHQYSPHLVFSCVCAGEVLVQGSCHGLCAQCWYEPGSLYGCRAALKLLCVRLLRGIAGSHAIEKQKGVTRVMQCPLKLQEAA